jgi:hypothetical protein
MIRPNWIGGARSGSPADRKLRIRVDGRFSDNTIAQMLNAALAGVGSAYVPEDLAQGP